MLGLKKAKKFGHAKGRAEGRAEGEEIGLTKGRKEIAKKLLAMGMPIEQIMEITDLTKNEIEALQN